jgi:hypothetical protein
MKSFITISLILCFSSLYSQVLNLYGYTDGKNYDTYLGCINCNQLDKNSINNTNGVYGSKFSTTSIYNSNSEFGSKFSDKSPYNQFATHPPIVVNEKGNFLGYLTTNSSFSLNIFKSEHSDRILKNQSWSENKSNRPYDNYVKEEIPEPALYKLDLGFQSEIFNRVESLINNGFIRNQETNQWEKKEEILRKVANKKKEVERLELMYNNGMYLDPGYQTFLDDGIYNVGFYIESNYTDDVYYGQVVINKSLLNRLEYFINNEKLVLYPIDKSSRPVVGVWFGTMGDSPVFRKTNANRKVEGLKIFCLSKK